MSGIDSILPIVLIYEEKGWTEKTVQCLINAGFQEEQIVYANRDGVGNMSRAFNSAVGKSFSLFQDKIDDLNFILGKKFIWFLTNVEFPPEMPLSLLSAFDSETAIVHPAFDSEHPHLTQAFGVVPDVPFIEWTAPMVRTSVFQELGGLDERLPYWGMDLHFSHQCRERGYCLKVDGRYRLKHNYLRVHSPEKISQIRKELRYLYDKPTEERLIEIYGEDYLSVIWPTHPLVQRGIKRIHP